jgi:hypothetical protein
MFRLSKITLLFSISLALLVALLFHSACNKDEDEFTREDFVDALKGRMVRFAFLADPDFSCTGRLHPVKQGWRFADVPLS